LNACRSAYARNYAVGSAAACDAWAYAAGSNDGKNARSTAYGNDPGNAALRMIWENRKLGISFN